MNINRREFLRRAAAYSAGAACTPWLLSLLGNTSCSSFKSKTGLADNEIDSLLAAALKRGGDFSEVYIEEVASLSFIMSESKMSQAIVGLTGGTGIRIVDGDRYGYAYANDFAYENTLTAAETAAFIAAGNNATNIAEAYSETVPEYITVVTPIDSVGEDRKLDLLLAADDAARSFSPYIKQVDITYYDHTRRRKIANSNGLRIENSIPLIWLVIDILGEKNGVKHQSRIRLSAHEGFEFFDHNDVRQAAIDAAKEAVAMLDARPAPSGSMPVVMNQGWGGVLIHEAVGHGLEGDMIYKGASIYSGKLGQKVASPIVTLIDDSSWPNARGTTGFDDEGTIGKRNVLIQDGVLVGFMQDRISAKMLNMELTGNGRRTSYRNYPMPRMTNTFLAAGDSDPEMIVSGTKKGLYVKALSGGSVDTISGQFNFVVREAYQIEDGKITYPVKGVTLIGKGIDVLTNIDAVGNNLELGVGLCGKGEPENQWVPVTAGMPTIRVAKGMIVGGNA
jgi:TldD protein